jgi:hypothetical protein
MTIQWLCDAQMFPEMRTAHCCRPVTIHNGHTHGTYLSIYSSSWEIQTTNKQKINK